jgi:hypothetical protein
MDWTVSFRFPAPNIRVDRIWMVGWEAGYSVTFPRFTRFFLICRSRNLAEYASTSSLRKCGGNSLNLYGILKITFSNLGTGNRLLVFWGFLTFASLCPEVCRDDILNGTMAASFQIPNFFSVMTQAISRRPVTTEAWVQYQNILCGICGVQIAGFPVTNFGFCCQYYSTSVP